MSGKTRTASKAGEPKPPPTDTDGPPPVPMDPKKHLIELPTRHRMNMDLFIGKLVNHARDQVCLFNQNGKLVAVLDLLPSAATPARIITVPLNKDNAPALLEKAWSFHRLQPLPPYGKIVECLSRQLAVQIISSTELIEACPPLAIVTDIRLPYLTPDGKVELTPLGYHPATGTYTSLHVIEPKPFTGDPTEYLDRLTADIAFEEPRDRAVWLAMAISLAACVIRHQKQILTPMFFGAANSQRTGKDAGVKLPTNLTFGNSVEDSAPEDEAKFQTVIEAALLEGRQYQHCSNIAHTVRSAMLERALTTTDLAIRLFKQQANATVRHNVVFAFTGNVPLLGGDLAPRTLVWRLRWLGGDPNLRKFSRVIEEWSKLPENRAEFIGFVTYALRLAAAEGWPDSPTPLASFRSWSKYIGVPAIIVSGEDFLIGAAEVQANMQGDDSQSGIEADWRFIVRWALGVEQIHDNKGLPVSRPAPGFGNQWSFADLCRLVAEAQCHDHELFAGARMTGDLRPEDIHRAKTALGISLRKVVGRDFGDWRIDDNGNPRAARCRYTLSVTSKP